MNLYPTLERYIDTLLSTLASIPTERQATLAHLSSYISEKRNNGKTVDLNFICTHNSRRSHISQIWAATAAAYSNIERIRCFSGGTEATAFNPRAVAAMERAGFIIDKPAGKNPRYRVRYSPDVPGIVCFSKVYDDPLNPSSDFAAIMTCSHADENCPFIPGATRIAITYEDPKVADDTPGESARYDERVEQIGREMFFVMGNI